MMIMAIYLICMIFNAIILAASLAFISFASDKQMQVFGKFFAKLKIILRPYCFVFGHCPERVGEEWQGFNITCEVSCKRCGKTKIIHATSLVEMYRIIENVREMKL